MLYYILTDDNWKLVDDPRTGYVYIEKLTHCCACHKFLSGYDGPRQALCVRCYEDNKQHRFTIRKTFGV